MIVDDDDFIPLNLPHNTRIQASLLEFIPEAYDYALAKAISSSKNLPSVVKPKKKLLTDGCTMLCGTELNSVLQERASQILLEEDCQPQENSSCFLRKSRFAAIS